MHNLLTTCTAGASSAAGSADQGQLAQILDEYLAALERGEPIAPDELLARHPAVADRLRGYLSGLAIFHRAAMPDAAIPAAVFPAGTEGAALQPGVRGPELRGQLGDFRLVREIGRGGMGVVYEAEQVSLGRRVALKVLPATSAINEKQITRFRNEAQAAAQIDHPHIVPVFAIGHELGIHYFAMQLIGGQSLGELIDKLRDDEGRGSAASSYGEERRSVGSSYGFAARVGADVAEALHAAHEIGVVHRDVKPSNLLIDEKGKVWITDFGVARCKTSIDLTETGHAVGTMAYMSPEQAEGQPALVDHRTDIYSLGVTLYELATLHHPGEGPADTVTAFEYDRSHWRSPRFWNKSIPVDLEVILLKALAEAREERYATARELAEDLTRFLEGRPIVARSPTLSSRVVRWAKRHQRAVMAGAMMLALTVAGLAISLLLITAERAERIEAHARERDRFTQARRMLGHVGGEAVQRLKRDVPGVTVQVELLADMLQYYEGFARDAANDPALVEDVALTHAQIGFVKEEIGRPEEAAAAYEEARAIFERLAKNHPDAQKHGRNLALCCNNLGQLWQRRGDFEAARKQHERALAIQERLYAQAPGSAELRADLATTHNHLGLLLVQRGERQAAADQYRAAIEIQEAQFRENSQDAANRQQLAASYNNLSAVFTADRPGIARRWLERALALQLGLAQEHPTEREYQSDVALCYSNLGALLARLECGGDAVKCFQDAIAIQTRLVGVAPQAVAYRRDLAVSWNNLGMSQVSAGELSGAENSFDKALEIQQSLVKERPDDAGLRSRLAGVFNNLGTVRQRAGRLSEACAALEQAIAMQREAYERAPQADTVRESLSKHYYNYAAVLLELDRPADAAAAAVARRELWLGDAEGLVRVAEELAAACKRLEPGFVRRKYVAEAAATLRLAEEAGLVEQPDLSKSPFDVLATPGERSGVTVVP